MFCLEFEASTTRSGANKSICSFNSVDFSRPRRSAHQGCGVRSDFFAFLKESRNGQACGIEYGLKESDYESSQSGRQRAVYWC
jgi:hypothetical protein